MILPQRSSISRRLNCPKSSARLIQKCTPRTRCTRAHISSFAAGILVVPSVMREASRRPRRRRFAAAEELERLEAAHFLRNQNAKKGGEGGGRAAGGKAGAVGGREKERERERERERGTGRHGPRSEVRFYAPCSRDERTPAAKRERGDRQEGKGNGSLRRNKMTRERL